MIVDPDPDPLLTGGFYENADGPTLLVRTTSQDTIERLAVIAAGLSRGSEAADLLDLVGGSLEGVRSVRWEVAPAGSVRRVDAEGTESFTLRASTEDWSDIADLLHALRGPSFHHLTDTVDGVNAIVELVE